MRNVRWTLALSVSLWLNSAGPLHAEKILLLSSGDTTNDDAIAAVLQSAGDAVTIGPNYNTFTGAGLSGYNAVFVNPGMSSLSYGSLTTSDMPLAGQQALLSFVNQGGGLIAGGAVSMLYAFPQDFQTLAPALPGVPDSGNTANTPLSFGTLSSNAVMNSGLPSTFSFQTESFAQNYLSEVILAPQLGALAFFTTNQWTTALGGQGFAAGSVGWNYGTGRVLSLSTFSDNLELSQSTYDQLLVNSVQWASQGLAVNLSSTTTSTPTPVDFPTPEPSSLAIFAAIAAGLLVTSRSRQRKAAEREQTRPGSRSEITGV